MTGVVEEAVRISMRDGVQLHARVTRPASGVAPVLLLRTPYSADGGDAAIVVPFVHPGGARGLAAAGWAVVHQDCRGRFGSEGVYRAFADDVADGSDTLEWCADQPWSTGRVVMTCPSGLGATQHLAALSHHPALAAIAPIFGTANPRRFWVREGGALQLMFVLQWCAQQGLTMADLSDESRQWNANVHSTSMERAADELASSPLRSHNPIFDAWVRDDPSYWAAVEQANAGAPADIPAFHTTGWYDIFAEGALDAYRRMRRGAASEVARRAQRLVVGPWSHTCLWTRTVGDLDFGPEADGSDGRFRAEMLAWLEGPAHGGDAVGGARVFVLGANRWVELEAWPPPARELRLHLGNESLTPTVGPTAADSFIYDPANPVPTCGGRALFVPDGPRRQAEAEVRDDVLVHTSLPLDHAVTVMGEVTADLWFSTSGRSADVTAKLVDVHPDGSAFNVVDSVIRSAFEPDRPAHVRMSLGSVAATFLPGHHIRLQVSSSNFPRLDRNPSTGIPASDATELLAARQTVYRGAATPSRLVLPTVDLP